MRKTPKAQFSLERPFNISGLMFYVNYAVNV